MINKNWRPKDWDNPYESYRFGEHGHCSYNGVEEGVRLILGFLEKGEKIPDGEGGYWQLIHFLRPHKRPDLIISEEF